MSTVVLIDVSHLFHRSFFSFTNAGRKSERVFDEQEDVDMFIRKVATDLMWVLRKIGHYDKVIACMDSHSWRKSQDDEYKGNREKSDTNVNWKAFYSSMDEFVQLISRHGFHLSKIQSAEADDLIALWSTYFFDQGDVVHIVSADGDLKQLVKFASVKNYVSLLNTLSKKRICYLHEDYRPPAKKSELESLFDPLSAPTLSNNFFDKIQQDFSIEYISPSKELLKKIFCGDQSDNISAVWEWSDSAGKKKRVTNSIFEKVYQTMVDRYGDIDVDEMLNSRIFQESIHRITESVVKRPVPEDGFIANLIRNTNLIFLNRRVFPAGIVEEFDSSETPQADDIHTVGNLNRLSLLENTRYEKKIEVYSDYFKNH